MYRCFVCEEEVKSDEEFEWHGCDGDKIHLRCKPKLEEKYEKINSMTDAAFINYLMGKDD